jgi:phage gp46-like protein
MYSNRKQYSSECKFWVIKNKLSIRVNIESRNLSEKCLILMILVILYDLQGKCKIFKEVY